MPLHDRRRKRAAPDVFSRPISELGPLLAHESSHFKDAPPTGQEYYAFEVYSYGVELALAERTGGVRRVSEIEGIVTSNEFALNTGLNLLQTAGGNLDSIGNMFAHANATNALAFEKTYAVTSQLLSELDSMRASGVVASDPTFAAKEGQLLALMFGSREEKQAVIDGVFTRSFQQMIGDSRIRKIQ